MAVIEVNQAGIYEDDNGAVKTLSNYPIDNAAGSNRILYVFMSNIGTNAVVQSVTINGAPCTFLARDQYDHELLNVYYILDAQLPPNIF